MGLENRMTFSVTEALVPKNSVGTQYLEQKEVRPQAASDKEGSCTQAARGVFTQETNICQPLPTSTF